MPPGGRSAAAAGPSRHRGSPARQGRALALAEARLAGAVDRRATPVPPVEGHARAVVRGRAQAAMRGRACAPWGALPPTRRRAAPAQRPPRPRAAKGSAGPTPSSRTAAGGAAHPPRGAAPALVRRAAERPSGPRADAARTRTPGRRPPAPPGPRPPAWPGPRAPGVPPGAALAPVGRDRAPSGLRAAGGRARAHWPGLRAAEAASAPGRRPASWLLHPPSVVASR